MILILYVSDDIIKYVEKNVREIGYNYIKDVTIRFKNVNFADKPYVILIAYYNFCYMACLYGIFKRG